MLISIDHGNYAMKTIHHCFTSGLAEHSVRPPLATDIIEYDGKIWSLIEQRITYMRDKSRDDRFFILTLFAIVKELLSNGELPPFVDVELAVGLPPEHFSALKEKFSQYLKRGGIKFIYNGQPVCIVIRQVYVYPQAYAAVVQRSKQLMETPRMFVIDIGGYTTDVLLLRNSKPDLQFCRSLESGVITMNNDIFGKVSALHDMKIEDDHITSVLQGKSTILPSEVIQTIFTSVKYHANGIIDQLRELQVDLRSNPAIFIGGGSILFEPFIKASPLVVQATFEPDPKANAIGYALLAASQMRKAAIIAGDGQ